MGGWFMATIYRPGEEPEAEMVIANPRGDSEVLSLPDGTEIEMVRAELLEAVHSDDGVTEPLTRNRGEAAA